MARIEIPPGEKPEHLQVWAISPDIGEAMLGWSAPSLGDPRFLPGHPAVSGRVKGSGL